MQMVIRLNGTDISANLTNIEDMFMGSTAVVSRPSNDTITASFNSGAAVDFNLRAGTLTSTARIPPEFQGNLTGLLGNFDGNGDNDFINATDLSIARSNISDSDIHDIAQTC